MQFAARTKTFAAVRPMAFVLLIACLLIIEGSQAQQLTLSQTNASLEKVMQEIRKQTNYQFIYNEALLGRSRMVTVHVKDVPLVAALNACFAGQPLTYTIVGQNIVLKEKPAENVSGPAPEPAGLIDITGRITDENNAGVSATVTEKGTGNATTSNADGLYTLRHVHDDALLLITAVNIEPVELSVIARIAINVQVKQKVKDLDGSVVIGYGRQRKRDITGAVSSVPASRMEMVPNLDISQVLKGSVAGISIQQSQGGAAPRQSIMIRGRNSILASNDPLIVVDGVPYGGDLLDINVNDIQSMEVLKDASAAAIYGSRGANGVILVTTKMGTAGKPRISFDARYGTQEAINIPKFLNGNDFYAFKQLREPGNITATEQAVYDSKKAVNWPALASRTGTSQQYNLSLSGGFQHTTYFIGGNYTDIKGVAINDGYRRVSARLNLETDVTDWLKLGTRSQFTNDNFIGYPLDWASILNTNPLTRPYDSAGNLSLYPWPEFVDIKSPLEPVNYDYKNTAYQLLSNNFLLIKFPFVKGLSYQVNAGIRRRFGNTSNYIGRNTATGKELGGVAATSNSRETNNTIENILSYTRSFGKHNIFATAAYTYEENSGSTDTINASGFPHDFITYYSVAQAKLVAPSYSYVKTVLNSQMFRLNYNYNGRYLLTLTARRDGYSGFGANDKWGVFPSVAVGWNVYDEKFFPLKDLFSRLKLRASYGLNGNQAVGAYASISRFRQSNIVASGGTLPGYVPDKIGVDNLGWESSRTLNLGLDFGVLRNRIEGEVNVFNTYTYDLLLNRTISLVNGFTSITQNIGKTRNTGVELSITSHNIDGRDFKWTTSGNLTFIRNKIVSLYGIKDAKGKEIDDVANSWFIGKPILSNYDYVYDGVWQTSDSVAAAKWGSKPGYAKIKDVNGDGKIDASDRQVIGHQDPSFIWGMNNEFSYRGVSLAVFMHGVHGVTRLNQQLQDNSSSSGVRRNVMVKNWWTPNNPTNDFYKNALNADKMGGISAPIYQNASFVRIRDITLSYDLSPKLIGKIGLSRLRLYVVGRNLFTFDKWDGGDPELNNGRGVTPLQREFVFGTNINF